ncbi:hypothetical protein AciX9_1944 [Granulicella tundricola MP5ACTX9]|uniref:Uncharacterized protein n=1 Tax=Granulicella tundricola (strain ATCC BAA-1859 / DSM 23138 / MP5ACTX9) TaxID=1198114 RepID=E8X0N9_GRATM|nr:hypothetical protein AciX9_1944 [Granulicella tundricola MP5ACTX9]
MLFSLPLLLLVIAIAECAEQGARGHSGLAHETYYLFLIAYTYYLSGASVGFYAPRLGLPWGTPFIGHFAVSAGCQPYLALPVPVACPTRGVSVGRS